MILIIAIISIRGTMFGTQLPYGILRVPLNHFHRNKLSSGKLASILSYPFFKSIVILSSSELNVQTIVTIYWTLSVQSVAFDWVLDPYHWSRTGGIFHCKGELGDTNIGMSLACRGVAGHSTEWDTAFAFVATTSWVEQSKTASSTLVHDPGAANTRYMTPM